MAPRSRRLGGGRAREALEPGPFGYIAGGAGSEATMRANLEAFERRRLRPRMLGGHVERDLSVEVLGLRSPVPFLLAPIGVLSIAHADAERAVARAAAATGVPMVLSSAASTSLEDVAAELGETPGWYQLYWFNDRELAASLVDRAGAAGYGAIVVTLDTLDARLARRATCASATCRSCTARAWRSSSATRSSASYLDAPPEEDVLDARRVRALAIFSNLGLTWADLDWLRGRTELPILVKGVLTAEDARHRARARRRRDRRLEPRRPPGGRRRRRARRARRGPRGASATTRPCSWTAASARGSDVLKALALGADAVLLGRPYAYGLAVGGQAGVEAVIRELAADLDVTLALMGGRSVARARPKRRHVRLYMEEHRAGTDTRCSC